MIPIDADAEVGVWYVRDLMRLLGYIAERILTKQKEKLCAGCLRRRARRDAREPRTPQPEQTFPFCCFTMSASKAMLPLRSTSIKVRHGASDQRHKPLEMKQIKNIEKSWAGALSLDLSIILRMGVRQLYKRRTIKIQK